MIIPVPKAVSSKYFQLKDINFLIVNSIQVLPVLLKRKTEVNSFVQRKTLFSQKFGLFCSFFLVNHFATREKFTLLEKNWPHAGLLFDTTGNRTLHSDYFRFENSSIEESYFYSTLIIMYANYHGLLF